MPLQSPAVGPLDLSKLGVVAPHVPLIRFRKGREQQQQQIEHQQAAVASEASGSLQQQAFAPAGLDTAAASPSGSVLEWWQRPQKFSRKPLDDQEIEVINGGGADVVFQ